MVSDERTDHYTPVTEENETDYGENERAKKMKTVSVIFHLLACGMVCGIILGSCIAETTDILDSIFAVIIAVFTELMAIYFKIN